MKKIILWGVLFSISIILMGSIASAVEYKTVIEQNNKEINIKTLSENLPELFPTIKIGQRHIIVRLILNFIRLIFFVVRTFVKISAFILIQILKIIRFPFKLISRSITLLINFLRLIIFLPIIRIGINHSPIMVKPLLS